MPPRTLADLIAQFLQHHRLPAPPPPAQDVYTLYFDQAANVHLFDTKDGRLDVMSEAGRLVTLQAAGTLLGLLELNHGRDVYPTSVTIDRASGTVIVFARQPLATLDESSMQKLLQCVHQKCDAVRQLLDRQSLIRSAPNSDTERSRIQRFLADGQ
jgi:hypothetical protein